MPLRAESVRKNGLIVHFWSAMAARMLSSRFAGVQKGTGVSVFRMSEALTTCAATCKFASMTVCAAGIGVNRSRV
jgi:hypothetical protein